MDKSVSISIDPSGAQTGGRVVKRELKEIGDAAVTAQKMTDQLANAQAQAAKSAQASAQSLFQQQGALRAQFNPTYAVLSRYKQTAEEIRQAHRVGALSVNEMTQALSRERQAALSAVAAIKGYNAALASTSGARRGVGSFETANLAAQFQDIAVTSAMGMSPLQIALQQGTQLSMVFEQMKASGQGAGSAILGAFRSVISPISLVTIGITAGVAALIQYFSTAESGTKTVDQLLSQHAENIRALKGAYGEAAAGLKDYVSESKATLAANARETLEATQALVTDAARDKLSEALGLPASDFAGNINVVDRFRTAINGLQESVKAGKPDLLAYRSALSEIVTSDAASASQKKIASELRALDDESLKAVQALPGMLKAVQVSAEESAGGIDRLKAIDLSQTTQSVTSLGTALQTVSQTAQGTAATVIDVAQQAATSQRQTLMSLQQSSSQLRTMKTELSDIQKALADAANTPVADVFGGGVSGQAATDAIARAATSVQKVFQALDGGQTTARQAHESLELIRQSLYQIGGDPRIIDGFIDALINGNQLVRNLESNVNSLNNSIQSMQDKTINIGIRQYTVPSAGGGTANVNVIGGNANMQTTQYDVGGGKTVGVTSFGNGTQSLGGTTQTQYNIGGKTITVHGSRATGGPVEAGKRYLVGEEGPELITMGAAGTVSNANSTAAILSGGRDTLSLMEDHLYNILAEVRIHTDYWEKANDDFESMITALQAIKVSAASSVSYSGGGGGSMSSSGRGSGGWGGYTDSSAMPYNSAVDFSSVYNFMGVGSYNGTGAIGYDTYGISPAVHGTNTGMRNLHTPYFATGGQIMPGEDQKVELFKKNSERVIIIDDKKVTDSRASGAREKPTVNAPITVNFYDRAPVDQRSRQAVADDIRRTVLQVMQGK
ncbi:phage tail length tape measure family protein [Rhizobium mongolense]|uniref:Bacteriophage tail tape measure N-terminal domain-containing protein n=1 Tax=Rhizobium mongolense TaxID=57676 RepID=A0A7W6RHG9_9HYPH|nr:phage tail length tape measure family protein [Rhizobium mongolense]MBB4272339.1 hypothetical protein [Rhizobium mongolense]